MHKPTNFSIIKYDSKDFKHLKFMQENLRNFYTEDLLNWQYSEQNQPYGGLYFAVNNDQILGSQGMMQIPLNIEGKVINSWKSESSFLISEARGKGIFEDLYANVLENTDKNNIQFVWGFTPVAHKVWSNKLNFEIFEDIVYSAKVSSNFFNSIASTFLSQLSFKKKLTNSVYFLRGWTKKMAVALNNTGKEVEVLSLDQENETFQLISKLYKTWEEIYPENIYIKLNSNFLNWRIVNHPDSNYYIVGFKRNSEIIGFSIFRVQDDIVNVLEIIALGESLYDSCLIALRKYTSKKFNAKEICYMGNVTNEYNREWLSAFEKIGGYKFILKGMHMVLKDLSKNNVLKKYCRSSQYFYITRLWSEGLKD